MHALPAPQVAFCIVLLCYWPSTAFKLFFSMLAMVSYRRYSDRYGRADSAAALAAAGGGRGAGVGWSGGVGGTAVEAVEAGWGR